MHEHVPLLILDNECQTIDNFKCTFPYEYQGNKYWTCIDDARLGIPSGSFWCPTDVDESTGKFKSVGECKLTNCPKRRTTQHMNHTFEMIFL